MKKILIFLFCLFTFLSCGKSDKFVGTWISSDWKNSSETIEIKDNEKPNYIVKFNNSNNEMSATEKNGILTLKYGFLQMDIAVDKNTKELLVDGNRFTKLTPSLEKEMEKYFNTLKKKIVGTWRFKRTEAFGFPNIQTHVVTYTYEITPVDEKDLFRIKATVSSSNEKNSISEKEVRLNFNGSFTTVNNITNDSLFKTFYLFKNVNELEKLEKIK